MSPSQRLNVPVFNGTIQLTTDTFAALFRELSEAEIASVLDLTGSVINHPESLERTERLDSLLRSAIAAVAGGDVNQAIRHLIQFARGDSRRAETLASDPAFAPIRAEVDNLINKLTATAKMDADGRIAHAVELVEKLGAQTPRVHEIRAETLILIARHFIDAGGYANLVHSAELSQMLIDQCRWAPVSAPTLQDIRTVEIASKDHEFAASGGLLSALSRICARLLKLLVAKLWLRAPLLVLLLVWLIVGLACGAVSALIRRYWPDTLPASLVTGGFAVWVTGFLALIAFGFYMRIRHVRFKKGVRHIASPSHFDAGRSLPAHGSVTVEVDAGRRSVRRETEERLRFATAERLDFAAPFPQKPLAATPRAAAFSSRTASHQNGVKHRSLPAANAKHRRGCPQTCDQENWRECRLRFCRRRDSQEQGYAVITERQFPPSPAAEPLIAITSSIKEERQSCRRDH